MKPKVEVGQEWEQRKRRHSQAPEVVRRIRVLELQANRMDVATVLPDGRLVRKRSMFVSALANTPGGYVLVKDAPRPAQVEEAQAGRILTVYALGADGKWHATTATYPSAADTTCGRRVGATAFSTTLDARAERCSCAQAAEKKAPHSCDNCDGIGLDACLFNPDRPDLEKPAPSPLEVVRETLAAYVPEQYRAASMLALSEVEAALRPFAGYATMAERGAIRVPSDVQEHCRRARDVLGGGK